MLCVGLTVTGCASAPADPDPSGSTRIPSSAASTASGATAGPDIAEVDLCVWVNTSLAAMNATFGTVELAYASQDQVLRRADQSQVVSCDIKSSGTDSTGHDEILGMVSLISGGEPVTGAAQRGVSEGLTYGAYDGMSAVEDYPPAALAAVQLESGLVLNLEGFRAAGNQDMQALFASGVKPLLQEMLDQRDKKQIYDLQADSHADAGRFCDALDLPAQASQLGLPTTGTLVTTASGVPNWDGRDLGGGGAVYTGTRTCGIEMYEDSPSDLWSWNSPYGSKTHAISFTFYSYPDAPTASDAFAKMTFGSALPHVAMGSWVAIADSGGDGVADADKAQKEAVLAMMTTTIESAPAPVLGGGD